jgi:hypothetical protein
MKSRVAWLEKGVENMKLFHNYANDRKRINIILEMHGDEGVLVVFMRLQT